MKINTHTAPNSVNGILKRSCGIGIRTGQLHDAINPETRCDCYEKGTVIINFLCNLCLTYTLLLFSCWY